MWREPATRDGGLTLIEVIVAVVLLTIVSLPVAELVIETGASSSQSRFRVEATNIAEQEIEKLQNLASFGNIPSGEQTLPSVTVAENGGVHSQTFQVTADYTLQADTTDGGTSVCTLASGTAIPPEIWDVTVTVGWATQGGASEGSVTEGTYLAPEAGGAIPATAGELAVPVYSGTTNQPYTAASVPIVVQGTWVGSGTAPSVPATETVGPVSGSTGSTGCAVFPNLDPATGWSYSVTVETSSDTAFTGVVTTQDLPGIVNTSSTTLPNFSESNINLKYGTATLASTIYVDAGVSVPVTFTTQCSACASLPPAAADLPLTVQANPQLTGPNNTAVFDTSAAPQEINSVTLYPYSDYVCWAGDTPDSAPSYTIGSTPVYPSDSATGCDAEVTLPTINVPVYAVVLKATYTGSQPTILAKQYLAPQETITLNALTGSSSPGTTSTGIPLGQYQLYYRVGSGTPTAISQWIWVTPTGIYSAGSAYTGAPTGTATALGTAISITGTL